MDTNIVPQNETSNKTQIGPPYTCFTCGEPSLGIRCYAEYVSPRAIPKPLDRWGEYIWYLVRAGSCRQAEHPCRVARLGDAITPLVTGDRDAPRATTVAEINEREEQAIANVRAALAAIAAAHGPNPQADPATSIVYQLIAGTLTPQAAIAEIGALCHRAIAGALETEPVLHWQEAAQ